MDNTTYWGLLKQPYKHYASNHEGVCLQFDVVKDPAALAFALPVEYNDEYPTLNWVDEGFNQNIGKALLRKDARDH